MRIAYRNTTLRAINRVEEKKSVPLYTDIDYYWKRRYKHKCYANQLYGDYDQPQKKKIKIILI